MLIRRITTTAAGENVKQSEPQKYTIFFSKLNFFLESADKIKKNDRNYSFSTFRKITAGGFITYLGVSILT